MTLSLVVDNPYRVLGTGTQAQNATLSANYKSLMTAALKGIEVNLGQDVTYMVKQPLRTPRRIDLAKSRLMSARGRIYYGLFWFMDNSRVDHAALYYLATKEREKAVKLWQSQSGFSSYINLAVLALLEERYDDAATLYSRCLQDEEMTQDFVRCIIGDKFKIKGAFVLSKVLEVLNRAKERKEQDENSDERSYVGAGHGVLNQESQKERVRLVQDIPRYDLRKTLNLRKEASSFDRHLNDALDGLIDRIAEINSEHGMDGDFVEVELNPNPAAQMVLDEITHFLAINNSLMEAFRQRCFQARERTMYLDYIYNLVSITHYAFYFYATELGRQYSSALVQQMRSIIAKIERLYFRLHSDDIDYLIASLRRVEDALPYYYAISNSFEKYYLLSDDQQIISKFYEFYKESNKVINNFGRVFGAKQVYADCGNSLQDMAVRYNVSFMLVLVNLALRQTHHKIKPERNAGAAMEQELRAAEQKMRAQGEGNGMQFVPGSDSKPMAVSVNNGKAPEEQKPRKLSRAERKLKEKQEKARLAVEERRSVFFKRKLARERAKFITMLERFKGYTVTPNTLTLIEVTMRQINRLPPPVSARNILLVLALLGAAAAAIYLNLMMK